MIKLFFFFFSFQTFFPSNYILAVSTDMASKTSFTAIWQPLLLVSIVTFPFLLGNVVVTYRKNSNPNSTDTTPSYNVDLNRLPTPTPSPQPAQTPSNSPTPSEDEEKEQIVFLDGKFEILDEIPYFR